MKTSAYLLSPVLILVVLLSGCLGGSGSKSNEITFYLLSQKEVPGTQKIGCGDYLVPERVVVIGEPSIEKALGILFKANPADYGQELITAEGIKSKFITLDAVTYLKAGTVDTIAVSLKSDPAVGLTGACDVPRIKEQIKETVRANSKNMPFIIRLDDEAKKWECLGNESGSC